MAALSINIIIIMCCALHANRGKSKSMLVSYTMSYVYHGFIA